MQNQSFVNTEFAYCGHYHLHHNLPNW